MIGRFRPGWPETERSLLSGRYPQTDARLLRPSIEADLGRLPEHPLVRDLCFDAQKTGRATGS